MTKRFHNIFAQIQAFEANIGRLEERCLQLEQKIDQLIQVERNHLIRIKNHEEISDEFINTGRKYLDLSPEKAWKLYCDKDFDYILLDVSSKEFKPSVPLMESIHIPWEEFHDRFIEITARTTPIFIISEDGTKSVLACEFLVSRGYFNCNNISGGYKLWKGNQMTTMKTA